MADNDTREETGYTEQSQSAFAEETVVVSKTKDNKGKLIMMLAGGFLFLMVALFGYNAYKKATTPSAPAPAPAQPAPAPADAPPSNDVAPVDPAASPVDPLEAAPVDPMAPAPSDSDLFGAPVGQTVDPTQAPAQPQFQDPAQQVPAQDPFAPVDPAVAPAAPVQAPVAPAQDLQAQVPAPTLQEQIQQNQAPVAPAPTAAPAPVAPASNDAVSALDQVRNDIMAGFDELRRSIENLAARQESFETSTNQRFDSIESRLSKVETGRANAAPTREAAAPKRSQAPVAAAKPRATPAKRRPAPAPEPQRRNSFEIIAPAPRTPVATTLVQTAPAVLLEEPVAAPVAPAVSFCPPSAVQPGRFWVRQADGSFRTYGEGDRLSSGTITRIDPASGIYVNGSLVCAGR